MNESAQQTVGRHLRGLAGVADRAADDLSMVAGSVAELVIGALERGNKLLFCGNGGSAADAQHLATEYIVRFRRTRKPLAALALTTDSSLLTAAANDLGFEQVFARQIRALAAPGDVLFLHSTSGESPNLLAAAHEARSMGVMTVGMLAGAGGPLRDRVDHALVMPTENSAHAQELHMAVGHAICNVVDAHFSRGAEALVLLHEARVAEKRQALYYRALAAAAEDTGDAVLSERLNGMHADEQHHLSRLTVRLVELGEPVADLGSEATPPATLAGWEEHAREREREEIARYETLLTLRLDEQTRVLIDTFLPAERAHAASLGGKWMAAGA